MTGVKMLWIAIAICVCVCVVAYLGWKFTARGGYESAEYTVLEVDGSFELREYPDLMMATTTTEIDSQGNDGSFSRLFGYISGANESNQKVAMTTPVFMQPEEPEREGQMGFVIPKQVASVGVPYPKSQYVRIAKRSGGKFAVHRFSGRMSDVQRAAAEAKLRKWIDAKTFASSDDAEFAGYDPPWTPGPFRRNEVLIRVDVTTQSQRK